MITSVYGIIVIITHLVLARYEIHYTVYITLRRYYLFKCMKINFNNYICCSVCFVFLWYSFFLFLYYNISLCDTDLNVNQKFYVEICSVFI